MLQTLAQLVLLGDITMSLLNEQEQLQQQGKSKSGDDDDDDDDENAQTQPPFSLEEATAVLDATSVTNDTQKTMEVLQSLVDARLLLPFAGQDEGRRRLWTVPLKVAQSVRHVLDKDARLAVLLRWTRFQLESFSTVSSAWNRGDDILGALTQLEQSGLLRRLEVLLIHNSTLLDAVYLSSAAITSLGSSSSKRHNNTRTSQTNDSPIDDNEDPVEPLELTTLLLPSIVNALWDSSSLMRARMLHLWDATFRQIAAAADRALARQGKRKATMQPSPIDASTNESYISSDTTTNLLNEARGLCAIRLGDADVALHHLMQVRPPTERSQRLQVQALVLKGTQIDDHTPPTDTNTREQYVLPAYQHAMSIAHSLGLPAYSEAATKCR